MRWRNKSRSGRKLGFLLLSVVVVAQPLPYIQAIAQAVDGIAPRTLPVIKKPVDSQVLSLWSLMIIRCSSVLGNERM